MKRILNVLDDLGYVLETLGSGILAFALLWLSTHLGHALRSKAGVCQDFAHIMTTLVRTELRIPCRYVSGYLYRTREDHDRSAEDATHAWVEAFLPHLGWVGFDPTNNLVTHHRHIRAAIGRDYADVPPTHGIYRGKSSSQLYVAVHVDASHEAPPLDRDIPIPDDWSVIVERAQQLPAPASPLLELQQMQQQQCGPASRTRSQMSRRARHL